MCRDVGGGELRVLPNIELRTGRVPPNMELCTGRVLLYMVTHVETLAQPSLAPAAICLTLRPPPRQRYEPRPPSQVRRRTSGDDE